ncbi:3-deoxy-manno-octulosonate cytidylyltransferase [Photobacterium leiognathi]|uniref:3-deoxy-manno-octulosonate cytidylyltransferase n=1 Tax=Photobacterium leiognathi TaxID=553611 RepID=UPI000769F21D|nr:3-deoxy-manno-octulosonate cytidylyltransferase [Photobacterium leiognathi]
MSQYQNIKVIIPARFNSSRLPGKPLLLINNFPIFWHVFQRCIEAGFSSENILLATDHKKIFELAEELNIPVVMTSDKHESGTDRINEVVTNLDLDNDSLVINVQGDEPLIPSQLIKQLALFALENKKFALTTAVTPICEYKDFINPNVVKAILGEGGRAIYFTRSPSPLNRDNSNSLELAYRHIGIYTYRVSDLKEFCSYSESSLEKYEKLEQLRALSNGMPIGACIYNDELPHGIDTQEDYDAVKLLMEV